MSNWYSLGYMVAQLKDLCEHNSNTLLDSQVNAHALNNWLAERLRVLHIELKNEPVYSRARYVDILIKYSSYDTLIADARRNRPTDLSADVVESIINIIEQ